MKAFREALGILLRYYELNARKVAQLMEANEIHDFATLIGMLKDLKVEIDDVIARVKKEAAAAEPMPGGPVKPWDEVKGEEKILKKPRISKPKPTGEYATRAYLKRRRYIVQRSSKIVYYNKQTLRCMRLEKSNKWGFTFKRG